MQSHEFMMQGVPVYDGNWKEQKGLCPSLITPVHRVPCGTFGGTGALMLMYREGLPQKWDHMACSMTICDASSWMQLAGSAQDCRLSWLFMPETSHSADSKVEIHIVCLAP